MEISDEFKLEFLNEILSDTTNLKIISNKEQLITFGKLIPGMMPLHPDGGKSISHFEFIADSLEVKDVDFIKRQFEKNMEFDYMQLEKYGFRVFDLQKLRKNRGTFDLYDTLAEMNKGFDSFYRTIITKPIFNEKKDKAYIMVNNFGGATYLLKMENGVWKIKSEFHNYVE
tara:strand:+ start:563 stop:1075 length:513 start_codon:yes stop_codon:yes gene_type:complete